MYSLSRSALPPSLATVGFVSLLLRFSSSLSDDIALNGADLHLNPYFSARKIMVIK